MNWVARLVSILFHPLLMATYMCLLFIVAMPSALEPFRQETFSGLLTLIFLVTFLLPAINILVFKIFGSISSLSMPDRRDRIIPFVFITILYVSMTLLFYWRFRIDFTDNVLKFFVIIDLLAMTSAIVTFFYKVSVHSIGICGLLGIVLPLNTLSENGALFYPTVGLIVLTGIVMSSRLQLHAHTLREVTVGGVLGFTISFIAMNVLF